MILAFISLSSKAFNMRLKNLRFITLFANIFLDYISYTLSIITTTAILLLTLILIVSAKILIYLCSAESINNNKSLTTNTFT